MKLLIQKQKPSVKPFSCSVCGKCSNPELGMEKNGPQHVDVVNIDYKKALVLILCNFEAFWLADKATSV